MTELLGHYELQDRLGVGGMGTVWRARDTRDGRIVAVKVLHPHLATDPDYIHRFERETRIAQDIDSPNVVKVIEAGRDGDASYIVMEYVAGQTLARLVQAEGRLDIDRAVSIASQVAHGLDTAHARGIVHRDISPQNVIIAEDGIVKLADFGVARDLAATAITGTQALLGKPEYIAPEVLTLHGRAPDIRGDIYALGIVLYQMLAGAVPFHGETPYGVLMAHVNDPPPDIAELRGDVPPWLVSVLARCLAKDPADRFQEPQALVRALEVRNVLTTITPRPVDTVVSRPNANATPTLLGARRPPVTPTPVAITGIAPRRLWWLLAVASGGLVVALALLAFALIGGRGDGKVTDVATPAGQPAVTGGSAPAEVAAATSTATPLPTRPPLPTMVPSRVCPTAPPANDAEFFKGCRVFEARMDGTSASFLLPRWYGNCGPDSKTNSGREISDVAIYPGLTEFVISKLYGQTNVNLNTQSRANYVVEYDIQFKPGSGNAVWLNLRTLSSQSVAVVLRPGNNDELSLIFIDNTTNYQDELATGRITGLKTGRRISLAAAVNGDRYTVFVDGKIALDARDSRVVSGTQKPIISTQACNNTLTSPGTLQLLGARVYELASQ